jgi:DNA-binding PadR family transcriptional regulator
MDTPITRLDYCILGLLSAEPMSGYSIRMAFEKTPIGNFSSSPGAIYPALRRLEKLRLVERKKNNDKRGRLFALTNKGFDAIYKWILLPVTREDVSKNRDGILLRVAFMDSAGMTRKNKQTLLLSFRKAVADYIVELTEYDMQPSHSITPSGRLALQHGIESYKATLKWISRAISAY